MPTRPRVAGKFLFAGEEKLFVRGVTYGTFGAEAGGSAYLDCETVERDFAAMAASGINAVRTYTVPPRWLFDCAARHGLRVMVGLPWEQHVAFLGDRGRARDIVERVRAGVRACAGHPAVLCYAIGNEIPAPIVRWYGASRIERFIERLYRAAKSEDPDALVTYVNYPSTEYLDLPFVDFVCFNVYLESEERLSAYLSRLQNLAGERPLVMAEVGLDSRRHGEEEQARTLERQIRTVFGAGCAGVFVFAWTDQWWRGGFDIDDWDFGLTGRDRRPKPALLAVRNAFAEVPFPRDTVWPRISVVVCTYNGARTIRDCLEGLLRLDYPDYEAIVVNDGSTDATPDIAAEYPFRLISTENRGLGNARNTGMEAATGEIVAYTDDDARPDPHWLQYLAAAFRDSTHAGIGGPNIAPAGDGFVAECIAHAPGGPVHVLLDDSVAEHIPGCNMAFRRDALLAAGGCDPIYRLAGDDVDLCWRMQQSGRTLGFSPAAIVWHHRRSSVRMYWRQQQAYGRAEALLERKWPEKYNRAGHLRWTGRLYGKGLTRALTPNRRRIFQGTWGSGLFQSVYEPAPGFLTSLPLMPEWYLLIAGLAALSALALLWTPLLFALPLLLLATGALLAQSGRSAAAASFPRAPAGRAERWKRWSLTALLHLLQPLARLRGRLFWGLTPWRRRGLRDFSIPRPRETSLWSESWRSSEERLQTLEALLRRHGACVLRGGDFDRWDLEVRGGLLGSARVLMAVEEHGAGKQFARFRSWPRCSFDGLAAMLASAALAVAGALDGAWIAAGVLGCAGLLFTIRILGECAASMAAIARAIAEQKEMEERGERRAAFVGALPEVTGEPVWATSRGTEP
ncbi:MAG TPA: glycosyltransferase [Thermoanaerobaculia bacterium]|nr:glycosyltransferase [Thermoanaerobaculia bacterium]